MRLQIDENDQVILVFDTSDEEKEIRELASKRGEYGTYVKIKEEDVRRANHSHIHSLDRQMASVG